MSIPGIVSRSSVHIEARAGNVVASRVDRTYEKEGELLGAVGADIDSTPRTLELYHFDYWPGQHLGGASRNIILHEATTVRSILSGIVLLCLPIRLLTASAPIHREDLFATSDVGVRIHIREVRTGAHQGCYPILPVHGARVPGVASFDLPVAGGSLAGDLAGKGLCAYVMDVRGYGQSTRLLEMEQPPQNHPPLVRSVEAVRDIDAAVDFIRQRTGASRVSLFGWATGGEWAGYYATLHSDKLSHLILLNALYGADVPHPLMGHGSDMGDPAHPGRLNATIGAYRCNPASSLLRAWNRSMPTEDKNAWRDPAVAEAYVRNALESDPEANTHKPPCFRSPNGALEDSFYLATGRQLWDASFI